LHPVMQSATVKINPVSRKDVKLVVASLPGSSSGSTTCKQLRLGPTQPQLKHRQLSCNHCFLRTPARNLKSSSFLVKLSRGTGSRKGWSSRGTARPNVPHASMDDFDFSAGPIEDVRPTFTRDAYEIPPPDPPKVFDNPPRKRKGRPKVTPPQAIAGSLIAAGCCVALFNFVTDSYFSLVVNPPVRHAPFHLEGDINALICTFVAGFGGFAVLIFGVNSVGLAMLAFKALVTPATETTKGD